MAEELQNQPKIKPSRAIRALKKRAEHLHKRIGEGFKRGKRLDFDIEEKNALEWALTELKEKHREQESTQKSQQGNARED